MWIIVSMVCTISLADLISQNRLGDRRLSHLMSRHKSLDHLPPSIEYQIGSWFSKNAIKKKVYDRFFKPFQPTISQNSRLKLYLKIEGLFA